MKNLWKKKPMVTKMIALILAASITAAAVAQDSIILNTEPVIFGANVISAGEFEFNASFTPDNKTVFFSKATTNWDIIALFSSTKKNNSWAQPVLLPFSGKYRDADPFVSYDGKKLFFISDRPINGNEYKDYGYHIFYVDLYGNKIASEPKVLDLPLPNGMTPLYPSIAANGNLYFTANTSGNNDIYISEWKEGKYQQQRLLPFNSNEFHDLDPVVAFDESFLIFTSNNRKGAGANDLYISFQKNGSWNEPMNLGPKVNTRVSDMAPGLSRDNKKLYFTSYREKIDRSSIDQKKMNYEKLVNMMHSFKNGIGNIYEIDISSIAPKK